MAEPSVTRAEFDKLQQGFDELKATLKSIRFRVNKLDGLDLELKEPIEKIQGRVKKLEQEQKEKVADIGTTDDEKLQQENGDGVKDKGNFSLGFSKVWGKIFGGSGGAVYICETDYSYINGITIYVNDSTSNTLTGLKISYEGYKQGLAYDIVIGQERMVVGTLSAVDANNYITQVDIYTTGVVGWIRFTTKDGQSAQGGKFTGDFESETCAESGSFLAGIRGRCGSNIDQIQFQWRF
eukprot:10085_1